MGHPNIIVVAMLSLGACASAPPPAHPQAEMPMPPAIRLADAPAIELPASAGTGPTGAIASPLRKPALKSSAAAPIARVTAANRTALREPASEDYLNAVQLYTWSPGALYRLYTAPGHVSDIALESGEVLVSVAAGDTARWIIGDTTSGSGASQRTHILVKPAASGLSTNLVIATDRRMYHVQAESSARTSMASIAWTYPSDALVVLKGEQRPVAQGNAGIGAATLDFDYSIEGDHPAWRPIRAFDDGRQVFIEFPATLPQGEAPPLFVAAKDGSTALVNYRVLGRYYVVDRLFSAAELRLGEARQQVVRIVRLQPGGKSRRRKSA